MRMRQCKRCGGNAVALQGPGGGPLCMGCIDRDGPHVEYICSIPGCGNQPVILAVVNDSGSAMVCGAHFKDIRDSVVSYLVVPPWLTEGKTYLTEDGDLELQIDLAPEDRP